MIFPHEDYTAIKIHVNHITYLLIVKLSSRTSESEDIYQNDYPKILKKMLLMMFFLIVFQNKSI